MDEHTVFDGEPHTMRVEHCGQTAGFLFTAGGQDTVRCKECNTHVYNAPREETGRPVRRIRTREPVNLVTRYDVLERDGRACFLCHADDVPLVVAHILSVADGREQGFSDDELNHPTNLFVLCAACNAGMARQSLPPRLLVALLRARTRQAS